jgi:hypothetical protein
MSSHPRVASELRTHRVVVAAPLSPLSAAHLLVLQRQPKARTLGVLIKTKSHLLRVSLVPTHVDRFKYQLSAEVTS